jgi:hypothetical protein
MEPKDKDRFIDEWLDAALKQRGAAEPRPGLENRVLAAVKAERERVDSQTWTWRPVWLSVAAILLIGIVTTLSRAPGKKGPASVESNVTVPAASKSPERGTATSTALLRKSRPGALRRASAIPRSEQFPSPQPLSEQEQILARYIERFPREAMLVAQAQTQLSKQEMIEQETQSPTEQNP